MLKQVISSGRRHALHTHIGQQSDLYFTRLVIPHDGECTRPPRALGKRTAASCSELQRLRRTSASGHPERKLFNGSASPLHSKPVHRRFSRFCTANPYVQHTYIYRHTLTQLRYVCISACVATKQQASSMVCVQAVWPKMHAIDHFVKTRLRFV